MDTVMVSPKYRVVIPEKVRLRHHIRPGDLLAVMMKHEVVQLVPVRPFGASKA
jgi:AbrB family looped-hinge helix DNA binding protein